MAVLTDEEKSSGFVLVAFIFDRPILTPPARYAALDQSQESVVVSPRDKLRRMTLHYDHRDRRASNYWLAKRHRDIVYTGMTPRLDGALARTGTVRCDDDLK